MSKQGGAFLIVGVVIGIGIMLCAGFWKQNDVGRYQLLNADYRDVIFSDKDNPPITSTETQKKSLYKIDTKTGQMWEIYKAYNDWAGMGYRQSPVNFPVFGANR